MSVKVLFLGNPEIFSEASIISNSGTSENTGVSFYIQEPSIDSFFLHQLAQLLFNL